MASRKDLTGSIYGRLTVLAYLSSDYYGGRVQTRWHCQCECGEYIDLFYDQLPTTALKQRTMMHSGRRLYDCCETCRQKVCIECGATFTHSRTTDVCEECSAQLAHDRIRFYYSEDKLLYQTDDKARADTLAYQRAYYHSRKESDPDFYAKHLEKSRRNRKKGKG